MGLEIAWKAKSTPKFCKCNTQKPVLQSLQPKQQRGLKKGPSSSWGLALFLGEALWFQQWQVQLESICSQIELYAMIRTSYQNRAKPNRVWMAWLRCLMQILHCASPETLNKACTCSMTNDMYTSNGMLHRIQRMRRPLEILPEPQASEMTCRGLPIPKLRALVRKFDVKDARVQNLGTECIILLVIQDHHPAGFWEAIRYNKLLPPEV